MRGLPAFFIGKAVTGFTNEKTRDDDTEVVSNKTLRERARPFSARATGIQRSVP